MERRQSCSLASTSGSQGLFGEAPEPKGRQRVQQCASKHRYALGGCLAVVAVYLLWMAWASLSGNMGEPGWVHRRERGSGSMGTFRLRVSGTWGMQPDYSSDRRKCPLYYEKLKYADIRDRRVVPYLLGGRQKPHCRHCNSNAPWAKFCSWDFSKFSNFRGPVCPDWLQEQLLSWMIESAERGRPGFKEMLTLTPCDLFSLVRGRTMWLMGDSMMQEFMKAIMCFMVEFWDIERRPQPPIKPHSEPYIDFEWPLQGWCIDLPQNSRICLLRANTADQMLDTVIPAFPKLGVKIDDVVVANFAMWHNTEDYYYGNMSRFREHVWFNLRDLPLFLWRDSSVQHFDTLTGDYVWPTRTNSCVPFQEVALDNQNHLQSWNPYLNDVVGGGWRNKLAYLGLTDLQMPIIHTWNVSLNMWNYHTNYREEPGDCTHMCHPSAYQYWIYSLVETLKALPPDARASAQRHLMRPTRHLASHHVDPLEAPGGNQRVFSRLQ
ncbi:g3905 [Coccomyxa viridis]|uniref:G3905 protein n=1 Tax=Coccomyxa viridis TaxID=1274662 RepID=A0ABP1FS74_9CHLO